LVSTYLLFLKYMSLVGLLSAFWKVHEDGYVFLLWYWIFFELCCAMLKLKLNWTELKWIVIMLN
jgi:hypothetical protein